MTRAGLLLGCLLAGSFAGADGQAADPGADRTTVIAVRHAEKLSDEGDPSLSQAGIERARLLSRTLSKLPVRVLYASQYRRTRETLEPLAESAGLPIHTHDARDVEGLARRIRSEHRGQVVVVSGHSNTIPALVRALGVEAVAEIADETYDDLFVVRLHDDGSATAVHLKYGAPSGPS